MDTDFRYLARDDMDSKAFKRARYDLGLTVRQMAEILNTTDRTVRKWESDQDDRKPNPTAVRLVCLMLDGMNPLKYIDVVE